MELVNNLPVILAAFFAIVAGLYGYLKGFPNSQVYWNMCLFLVVFYLVGALMKRTLKGIFDELAEKAENEPIDEQLIYTDGLLGESADTLGEGETADAGQEAAADGGVEAAEGNAGGGGAEDFEDGGDDGESGVEAGEDGENAGEYEEDEPLREGESA